MTKNFAATEVDGDWNLYLPGTINPPLVPHTDHGLINLGEGPWDGTSPGAFLGDSAGTLLATNVDLTFLGRLFDIQREGKTQFAVESDGSLILPPAAGPSIPPNAALAGLGAGNLSNGAYLYAVSFLLPSGLSALGASSSPLTVVNATVDGQVDLTNIPIGISGTNSRVLYRTKAGGSSFFSLDTLYDNTTTTYTDNIPDSSLVVPPPPNASGGGLVGIGNVLLRYYPYNYNSSGAVSGTLAAVDSSNAKADLECMNLYASEIIEAQGNNGQGGLTTTYMNRRPVDADFVVPPHDGTIVLDRSHKRLYVRISGIFQSASFSYWPAGPLFDHYADAANGTTVETDLYSDTIPATQFYADGDKIVADYALNLSSVATSTEEVRAYFAGTKIFDSGALSVSVAASWRIRVLIIRSSSTTARCVVDLAAPGVSTGDVTETDLTGLDFTATNILKITGQAGGVAGGSGQITAKLGTVTYQPAA